MDYDPSPIGTNYQFFDPINAVFFDHAIGDNITGNGVGSVAANAAVYAGLIAHKNVAQNSWSLAFFNDATHIIDPNIDGTYTIQLEAFIPGAAPILASIDVIVGTASPVPEPIAFLTWAGLIGCAAVVTRRKQH